MKKKEDTFNLKLVKTKDIAKELGQKKKNGQILVGFALETTNEEHNALAKLKSKNLDFIVLNSMNDQGAGFQHDTNKITILDKHDQVHSFEMKSKVEVAEDIVNKILEFIS